MRGVDLRCWDAGLACEGVDVWVGYLRFLPSGLNSMSACHGAISAQLADPPTMNLTEKVYFVIQLRAISRDSTSLIRPQSTMTEPFKKMTKQRVELPLLAD